MKLIATNSFLLNLPESWVGNTNLILSGKSENGQQVMVNISALAVKPETTATRFGENIVQGLQNEKSLVKLISAGEFPTANGAGFSIHSEWPDKKGTIYHQWQLIAVQNGNAIVFVTTLPGEKFEQVKTEIEQLYQSIIHIE